MAGVELFLGVGCRVSGKCNNNRGSFDFGCAFAQDDTVLGQAKRLEAKARRVAS
jgi:hypothetical protein